MTLHTEFHLLVFCTPIEHKGFLCTSQNHLSVTIFLGNLRYRPSIPNIMIKKILKRNTVHNLCVKVSDEQIH